MGLHFRHESTLIEQTPIFLQAISKLRAYANEPQIILSKKKNRSLNYIADPGKIHMKSWVFHYNKWAGGLASP